MKVLAQRAGAVALLALMMLAARADGRVEFWQLHAPFPEPGEGFQAASAQGKLYVFQGVRSIRKPMGLVYEYDPRAEAWTKKRSLPQLAFHSAVVELHGRIYLFGGFVLRGSDPPLWDPIDNAWEYDPAADAWRALAPLPTRRGAAAAAALEGKLYVIGGEVPDETDRTSYPPPLRPLGTLEEYDPLTNTWRQRRPMPTPRSQMAVGSVQGKIYVIGGRLKRVFAHPWYPITGVVEGYDPATDTWSPRAPMPTPRIGMAYGVMHGGIYVAGGAAPPGGEMLGAFRIVERYWPAADAWNKAIPMSLPRYGAAGATLPFNRFHVVSGAIQALDVSLATDVEIHTRHHEAYHVGNR